MGRCAQAVLLTLIAIAFWATPYTIAVSQTQCVSIDGTADGVDKSHAVERSLKSLREAIDKWKTENGMTGPVSETAEKPTPHPYWRNTVPSYALLSPDVVSDSAYTICWTGVVSPVVCTSGAQLCR